MQIRSRFFDVYNASVQKKLFDRLLYIVCSQNWEHCGGYFWIKHCLEVGGWVGESEGVGGCVNVCMLF